MWGVDKDGSCNSDHSLLRNQQDSKKGSPSTWVSFNVRDEQKYVQELLEMEYLNVTREEYLRL